MTGHETDGFGHRRMPLGAIAFCFFAGLVMCDARSFAAKPTKGGPVELIGPLAPSIHVPPVRSSPPERTRLIVRPPQYSQAVAARKQKLAYKMESLRVAIDHLVATYGTTYVDGQVYQQRWHSLARAIDERDVDVQARFLKLRADALLANPLLGFGKLLVLKRKKGQLGLPTNHQCNTCLPQDGYENELAILSSVCGNGQLATLYRPPAGRYVGEMDLHYDSQRLLFTMPNGRTWQIHEFDLQGKQLRQVSREVADVDNFDGCYLPDGRVVFGSTASFTGVPCWHGRERACCLYTMNADGSDVRQLCYDQDLDLHPSVLSTGQIIFSRWDYTGLLHAYVRPLMVMNPDGTGQRAVYGSNSYYPNCLFFPRAVPGSRQKIVATLSGYHGKNRMGELAVLDLSQGWNGEGGIVHRITHRGEPIVPVAVDTLTQKAWPQFLHPFPLSDTYILTAMQPGPGRPWGIYLVDVFDNIVPILTDAGHDFFEPIPVQPQPVPRVVPDRTDPSRDDAVVVLHDIYRGPGLRGVPRGAIKSLRVAAYHFGYPGMAGPDKVGRSGPWEVMRILGTVPVREDGSAKFRVPANTPLTLQALDQEGKAVQLMRSWYTAMPGETTSCVGCHETPSQAALVRDDMAATLPISEIKPWYGPARGFDFGREVQPVLDRYCVDCHDGRTQHGGQPALDLRDEHEFQDYSGLPLTMLGATRLDESILRQHPNRFPTCGGMPKPYGGLKTHYTPAYEALIPFVRRVNIEDGAGLLRPGEYHADTSQLIQMLRKGHHGVHLDHESWDRLVTWIDLNGPCHGTWGDVADVPAKADRRRHELAQQHGGPRTDPEFIPDAPHGLPATSAERIINDLDSAQRRQQSATLLAQLEHLSPPATSRPVESMTLVLRGGLEIELIHVPAGRLIIGDLNGDGADDEWPATTVEIERSYWIGSCEITNEQFRHVFPDHDSGFFTKRQIDRDGPGIQLDGPRQPAIRVSWNDAMSFCRQVSEQTGRYVTLPTEAQWEYAARAGTTTRLSYGDVDVDFSHHANMADRSLACIYEGTAGVANLQPIPSDMRFDDQAIGTADVASYAANAWGLYDMHGNAAEWTRSAYRPYPYDKHDGRNEMSLGSLDLKRVVRGGSFYDRGMRCRSAFRLDYPAWQPVFNVGFRVVVTD